MKICYVVMRGRWWEGIEAVNNVYLYGRKVTIHRKIDFIRGAFPFFNDSNIHNNISSIKNSIGIIARARLIDYRGLHGMLESGVNFS